MNRLLLAVAWTTLFVPLLGGTTESDDIANELYVNASKSIREMKFETEFGTFSKALRNYLNASEKLENITSDYASTSIAVNLVSGKTKISDLTLSEFQTLESSLQNMASAEQEPNACALFIANTVDDVGKKVDVLTTIANTYVKMGQKEKAVQILSQALETANTIQIPDDKTSVLTKVSKGYSKLEMKNEASELLSQAYEVTHIIDDNSKKAYILDGISKGYLENGQEEKADQVLSQALIAANLIKDSYDRGYSLVRISGRYFDAGKGKKADQVLSQALIAANSIKDMFKKSSILILIGSTYIKNDNSEKSYQILSQALITASKINDIYLKTDTFTLIADVYTEAGQKEKSVQIISKVLDNNIDYAGAYNKTTALTHFANSYIKLGQNEKAVQIISEAAQIAKTVDSLMINSSFYNIVKAYTEAEQITLALETAELIEDGNIFKSYAFSSIVRYYINIGMLSKALETAKRIEDASTQSRQLSGIATSYTKLMQRLNEKDLASLHEIVYKVYTSRSGIKAKKVVENSRRTSGRLLEEMERLGKQLESQDKQLGKLIESSNDWRVSESKSPIDDSPSVTMIKAAESGGQILVIRCFENKTTAYISTGTYLGYEHSTRVTTRLDKEKARTRNWTMSTDSKGVFAPGGYIKWIKSLMGHKKLLVRVSPRNSSSNTFEFTVNGLENAIKPLRKACHW